MTAPAHIDAGPEIIPGTGVAITVTTLVATAEPQPLVTVYEIVSIPATRPVTSPVVLTDADALLRLHVPPVAGSVSVTDEPVQTVPGPEMVAAVRKGPTVITLVADAVPQLLVMRYVIVSVPTDTPVSKPVAVMLA